MADKGLYPEDFAEFCGISAAVVRKMLNESRRAHEAGIAEPKHLPLPDEIRPRKGPATSNGHHSVTVKSPWWKRSTIRAWLRQRPGRGRPGVKRTAA